MRSHRLSKLAAENIDYTDRGLGRLACHLIFATGSHRNSPGSAQRRWRECSRLTGIMSILRISVANEDRGDSYMKTNTYQRAYGFVRNDIRASDILSRTILFGYPNDSAK